MSNLLRTPLYDRHVEVNATMVDFGGWEMPIQYPVGIVAEHLWTRRNAGMFDVSHMGRVVVSGEEMTEFLQYVLTSNVAALQVGMSQYCIIADENGYAIDDAYLYRFYEDRYLLVINASNREKDLVHLNKVAENFKVTLVDETFRSSCISVQGPTSEKVLMTLSGGKELTAENKKNATGVVDFEGHTVWVSRTGYTGEPIGFEICCSNDDVQWLWKRLREAGAKPCGLGSRDTMRLESALPLYGHEFGVDKYGNEIPAYAVSLARFAVSFAEEKGNFIGREKLLAQAEVMNNVREGKACDMSALPKRIVPVALLGKGVMRADMDIYQGDELVGYVTSGTMVPYHKTQEMDCTESGKRAIGFAYINSNIVAGDKIEIDIRGKRSEAVVVAMHMKGMTRPLVIPVLAE